MKRKRKGHHIPQSSAESMELHGSSSSSFNISSGGVVDGHPNDPETSTASTDAGDDDDDRGSSILRTVFELPPVNLSGFQRRHSPQQQTITTRSDSSRSNTFPDRNTRSASRQQQNAVGLSNGSATHNDVAISDERASHSSAGRSSSRRSVNHHRNSVAGLISRSTSRAHDSPEKHISSSPSSITSKSKQKSPPIASSSSTLLDAASKPNGHANGSPSPTSSIVDEQEPPQRISPVPSSSLSQALNSNSYHPNSNSTTRHHFQRYRDHSDAGVDVDADDDGWPAILIAAEAAKSSATSTQVSAAAPVATVRRSKSPARHSGSPAAAAETHAKRNSTPLSSSKSAVRHSPRPVNAADDVEAATEAADGSRYVARRSNSPSTATNSAAGDASTRDTSRRRRNRAGESSENPNEHLVDSLSRHFRPKNVGKRLRRSSNLDTANTTATNSIAGDNVTHTNGQQPPLSFTASLKRRKKSVQPQSESADANLENSSTRKKKSPLKHKRDRNRTSGGKKTPKNCTQEPSTSTVPRAVAALHDYLTPYYSLSSSSEVENDDDGSQAAGGADTVSGSHAPTSTFFDSSADDSQQQHATRRSRRKRKALRRFSLDSRSNSTAKFAEKPKILDVQGDLTMQTASSSAAASVTQQTPRLPRDVVGLSDYLTDFFNPATERRSRKPPRRLEDRTPTPPKRGTTADNSRQQSSSRKSSKKRRKTRGQLDDELLPPRKVELTADDFALYENFQKLLAESGAENSDADDSRLRTRTSSVAGNPVDATWRRKFQTACRLANESIDKVDALPPPPSPVRVSATNMLSTPYNDSGDRPVHRPRVRGRNKPSRLTSRFHRLPENDLIGPLSAKSDKIPPDDSHHPHITPCPASIQLGPNIIQCQYQSQYPEEYARCKRLFVCEFCLTYFKTLNIFNRHIQPAPTRKSEIPGAVCGLRSPPGREIYRSVDNAYSIFEVCGRQVPTYCTQLCLLAKLFLHHKTVFLDVEPFNFYVMTRNDFGSDAADADAAEKNDAANYADRELRHHFVGYFSKERDNPAGWNVSCIVVLPTLQNLGYGRFLIEFSFLLSRQERKPGSPEKPLSEQGERAYKSFYRYVVAKYCLTRIIPQKSDTEQNATADNSSEDKAKNSQLGRRASCNTGEKSLTRAKSDVVDDEKIITPVKSEENAQFLLAANSSKKPVNAATTPFFTTLNDLQCESGMTLQDIGETLQDLGVFKLDLRNLAAAEKKRRRKPKFWLDFSPPSDSATSWLATMLNIIRRETRAERSGKRIVLDEARLLWQPRILNPHHHLMPFNDVGLRKSALQIRKPDEADEKAGQLAKIKKLRKLHAAAMSSATDAGKSKKAAKKPKKLISTATEVAAETPARRTRRRIAFESVGKNEEENADVSAAVGDADVKSEAAESSHASSFAPEDDEESDAQHDADENDDDEIDESENDDGSKVSSSEAEEDDEDEIIDSRRRNSTRSRRKRMPSPVSDEDDDDGSSTVVDDNDSDGDENEEASDQEEDGSENDAENEKSNRTSVADDSAEPSTTATADDGDQEEVEDDRHDDAESVEQDGDLVDGSVEEQPKKTGRNRSKKSAASAARKVNNRSRNKKIQLDDDDEDDDADATQQPRPRTSLRISTRKQLRDRNDDENDRASPPVHMLRSRRGSRAVAAQT